MHYCLQNTFSYILPQPSQAIDKVGVDSCLVAERLDALVKAPADRPGSWGSGPGHSPTCAMPLNTSSLDGTGSAGLNLQAALHLVMQAMEQNVHSLPGGLIAPGVLQNP